MKTVAGIINAIKSTNSRTDKINIIRSNKDNEKFIKVLYFIFDPYTRTGIGAKKLEKTRHRFAYNKCDVDSIIEYFTDNITGDNSDCSVAWNYINSVDTEIEKELVRAIVTKTLKIGVTAKTINQALGKELIRQFGVMLGSLYKDNKKVKGPYIVTEKLDGHRCIIVKDKVTTFYSRSGKVIEGLVDIEKEVAYLPTGYVYDGECLAEGTFKGSLEQRMATNSIMLKSGEKRGVTFNIFDMVPACEFVTGKCTEKAEYRKKRLAILFGQHTTENAAQARPRLISSRYINAVPVLGIAHTEEEVMEFAQKMWAMRKEGVMLNVLDSVYELKRSKNLLKVKDLMSVDLPIIGFQEGTGKYKGMLGAFVVNYKNFKLCVGSGLTDMQRRDYWEMQDKLLGVPIEIDTFGETKNKNGTLSLNAPIFKGLRFDKRGDV
jgi:DNA ligase-1